jgi:hypothetical protein
MNTTLVVLYLFVVLKIKYQNIEMDGNISDVISKLKFIGLIQKGEKINVRGVCVQQDTFFTRVMRTFITLDNRTNAYNFIEGIINRSFEIILLNINKETVRNVDKRLVCHLISDIKKSTIGIKNLKDTYTDDIMFCCKLDALIECIESKLTDITEIYEQSIIL